MNYCGIDLHSNRFTCCFLYEDGNREKITFDVSADAIEKFKSMLNLNTSVIIEASTNTFKFAESIKDLVNEIVIVNTYKMKLIPMSGKKTDKVDAEKLAVYLKMCSASGENLIRPVYIPDDSIQDLRSLFTTHNLIKRHIGAIKNRIHSLLKQHLQPFTKEYIFGKKTRALVRAIAINSVADYQLNLLFEELEAKEKLLEDIENRIKIEGAKYIEEIKILTSMTGISVLTALAIIADIATIERFPNAKHFTSYLRTAPEVDSSNETVIIKGTNKSGRKLSVTLLSQALNHFRDSNPRLKYWYNKKEEYHFKKGKLRMALCRKVFAEIYHMLDKCEYHYYRNAELHNKKMNEYYKFLEVNGVVLKKTA